MQELSSGDAKYELSRARKKKAQQRTKLHWWPQRILRKESV
jgi:hypothetical protein